MIKILVPVDFSQASLNAIEYASKIGEKQQSVVTLLYVFTEDEFNKVIDQEEDLSYDHLQELAEKKLSKLAETVKKSSGKRGLTDCNYEVIPGKLDDVLLQYIRDNHYLLVVMGTTGAGNVRERLVGSNTVHAIEKASCNILAVPEESQYQPIHKIIYASDYQEEDKIAIQQVVSLAMVFNAKIKIVHIGHDDNIRNKAMYEQFKKELGSFISYERVSFDHKLYHEDIAHAIDDYVQEEEADMLVLLRKQRSFFQSLFAKSITKQMAYFTSYPLLVLKLQ